MASSFTLSKVGNARADVPLEAMPSGPLTSAASIAPLAKNALESLQQARLSPEPALIEKMLEGRAARLRATPQPISLSEWFDLDEKECQLLKEIMKEWRLGPELPLFTVFRLDLYRRISSLKMSEKNVKPLLDRLLILLSNIQNHHERVLLKLEGGFEYSASTHKFFPSKETNEKAFNGFRKQLKNTLNSYKMEENYHWNLKSVIKIDAIIDLFIEFFCQNFKKETQSFLLGGPVGRFQEAEHLHQLSVQNDPKVLENLNIYMHSLSSIRLGTSPEAPSSTPFAKLASLFANMQKGPLTQASATKVKNEISKQWRALIALLNQATPPPVVSAEMKLNLLDDQRCLPVELHFLSNIGLRNILLLLSGFMNGFDCQILRPLFPELLPISVHMQRLIINLRSSSVSMPTTSNCTEEFQKSLSVLIKPLENDCVSIRDYLNEIMQDTDPLEDDAQGFAALIENASYTTCVFVAPSFSFTLASDCEKALQKVHSKSKFFSSSLEQFFQDQIQSFAEVHSEADRQTLVDEIQSIYWDQTLFLRRMMMIIEDILAITRGTRLIRDARYSTWDAVDVMRPDKLYALLWPTSLLEEKREILPTEEIDLNNWDEALLDQFCVTPPPLVEAAAAEDLAPPRSAVSPAAEVERVESASLPIFGGVREFHEEEKKGGRVKTPAPVAKRQKKKVRETQEESSSLVDLLKMRRFRDIFKELKAADFTRARVRGSHFIMIDQFGRNVIVPRHRELKEGTVYGIYAQAIAPIKKT